MVDADDLEDDPAGVVEALCAALKIPFIAESLSLEAEHKSQWDVWKDWHSDAARSTRIVKNMETFEVTVDNNDRLRALFETHNPHYDAMAAHRIGTT